MGDRTVQEQAEDVAADAINLLATSNGKAVKVEHASPNDGMDDNEVEGVAAAFLVAKGKAVRIWNNSLIVADTEEAIAAWAAVTSGSDTAV